MTYKPEDYQVTNERAYADGGNGYDVNILGAEFTIYRVMNKFQPTSIFKFNKNIGLLADETGKIIGSVEIDWDTCLAGMLNLAKQMGLKCIPGVTGKRQTYFVEVSQC